MGKAFILSIFLLVSQVIGLSQNRHIEEFGARHSSFGSVSFSAKGLHNVDEAVIQGINSPKVFGSYNVKLGGKNQNSLNTRAPGSSQNTVLVFLNSSAIEVTDKSTGNSVTYFGTDGPTLRTGHSTSVYNSQLYIFGGVDNKGVYQSELWSASLSGSVVTWQFLSSNGPVSARAFHSAVVVNSFIFIFGGISADGYNDDGWKYDLTNQYWADGFEWTQLAPSPRAGHVGVLWTDGSMYIWGGVGVSGTKNDMWRYNFASNTWTTVYTNGAPSARAFVQWTISDSTLTIIGGKLANITSGPTYWSPSTGIVSFAVPGDFAADEWTYTFSSNTWNFEECLADDTVTDPDQCVSSYGPSCTNDCSGNGFCLDTNFCLCKGDWSGADCSQNNCSAGAIRGFTDLDLVDKILVGETLLKLGKGLANLRDQLKYLKAHLPPYNELVGCEKFDGGISEVVLVAASTTGLAFHQECMGGLISVLTEFNKALDNQN